MKLSNLKNWLASRARTAPITTIVLHSTDGWSAASSISWLREIRLSYHYIIERDGEVTKCVPLSRVAFHAGKSTGPQGKDVNPYSVGISFANRESKKEKITDNQIRAMRELVTELKAAVSSIIWIPTHYWVSPGRKTDPAMLSRLVINDLADALKLKVYRGGL